MNPTRNRSSIIYLLLFVAIIAMVVYQFQQQTSTEDALTINEVAADIEKGNVKRIIEDDNQLRVIYAMAPNEYRTRKTALPLLSN